ncbi:MAG: RNA-processing protein [Candidatus Diapherotrites archaeon]|uniref:RNA-processing protein n=1 Tax=Candidatus Iainarchaeum sp. TaxID=3101447 RepID=A0A8T3YQB5_9ARCH|nr:RNA-processing protein [Candidatus Diapherotrites archaeon]
MDDSESILVPHDRIGAIIGKKGETKRDIEARTDTKIIVDSREGEVEIVRKGEPIKYLRATRVVKALGRGFSPEHAFRLLNDDCMLEIIELQEVLGKNQSRLKAKKGRVIGEHGRARAEIERDTGASISVYGKTIGIIGTEEEMERARHAVEMLIGGASHTTVYSMLRKGEPSRKFEL